MPRVGLTEEQTLHNEAESLCKTALESIEQTFVVKRRMNKQKTADALNLHRNTWANWRTRKLDGVPFRDVAIALTRAGYKVTIEKR
jgi:hypothetical protein